MAGHPLFFGGIKIMSAASPNGFITWDLATKTLPLVSTSGTSLLKGDGSGLFTAAAAGTDYQAPLTFGTGLSGTTTITANLSAGVSGGQIATGGSGAGETLTLRSTSNLTKGKILFGTSCYDEVNNRLGIGTTTPTLDISVVKSGTTAQFNMISYSTATQNRAILFFQTATGTVGSPGNVADNDLMGEFIGSGYAGGAFRNVASMNFRADTGGTISSTSLPAHIFWEVTPNGSVTRAEKMRLSSTGRLYIGGIANATGVLHLAAGTATASTAPLKLTTGTNLTAAEAGALEYASPDLFFTPGSAIRYNLPLVTGAGVQGDLVYASAASIYSRLAKDANATRYISNQGTSNNPSWNQINLANGVTGTLPVANGGTGQTTSPRLFSHFADANNSGTGETDLYSDTITAAKLATNGDVIETHYTGVFSGAVSSQQQLKIYFGGTAIFDSGALAIGVATPSWDIYLSVTRVSSSVVRASVQITTSSAALAASSQYTEVTGLTLANTQILKITGTASGVGGASNQITAKVGYVDYKPV